MTDVVHEGTHALEAESPDIGTVHEQEMRAYSNEHEFQKKLGIKLEFKNKKEIILHIENHYSND